MFIPNGRLSAIGEGDETIQVQTEFGLYPRPRVTTTVVLAGRVVHKEEHPWDAKSDSPEARERLESFLKKQHLEVHSQVESGQISVESVRPQASSSRVAMPSLPPPTRHPAGRTPGVLRLFIVSKSGDLLAADDSGVPGQGSTGLFKAAAEFIEFWEIEETERFAQMITNDRDGDYLLVRHFGKYWGAELAPGVDPHETLQFFIKALDE
jgi:hypothetical protein